MLLSGLGLRAAIMLTILARLRELYLATAQERAPAAAAFMFAGSRV